MTWGAYSTASVSKESGLPSATAAALRWYSSTFSSLIPTYSPGSRRKRSTCFVVREVPRDVLGAVLAGLGGEATEAAIHVDPHPPAQLGVGRDALVEQRVEVLAGALETAAPTTGGSPRQR